MNTWEEVGFPLQVGLGLHARRWRMGSKVGDLGKIG